MHEGSLTATHQHNYSIDSQKVGTGRKFNVAKLFIEYCATLFYASEPGALESPFNESKSSRYLAGPLPAVLFSEISTYLEIRSQAVPPPFSSRDARYSSSSFLEIVSDEKLKIDVPCLCDGLFFLIVVILIKIIDGLFCLFDGFLFLLLRDFFSALDLQIPFRTPLPKCQH